VHFLLDDALAQARRRDRTEPMTREAMPQASATIEAARGPATRLKKVITAR
jgi:hypothetical protein